MKKIFLIFFICFSSLYGKQIIIAGGPLKTNYMDTSIDINKKIYMGKAKIIQTAGSVENMLLVAQGKADIALVQADALAILETFFMKEKKSTEELLNIIGTPFVEYLQVLVPKNSDINSIDDLDGKIIVSGGKKSGSTISATHIEHQYNINFKKNLNVSYEKGYELLKQNKVDAMIFVAFAPNKFLGNYYDLKLIELAKPIKNNPYFHKTIISKNSYKFLNKDIKTYGINTLVIVKKGFKDIKKIHKYLKTIKTATIKTKDYKQDVKLNLNFTFNIPRKVLADFSTIYGYSGLVKLTYLNKSLMRLQYKTLVEQLTQVNKLLNKLHYSSDIEQWQKEDYWSTPLQTIGSAYCDTEEFALMKFLFLVKLGISQNKLKLIEKDIPLKVGYKVYNENIALAYFHKSDTTQPVILDYDKKKYKIYKYNNQFKYKIITKSKNKTWNKLFSKNFNQTDVDDIMKSLY